MIPIRETFIQPPVGPVDKKIILKKPITLELIKTKYKKGNKDINGKRS